MTDLRTSSINNNANYIGLSALREGTATDTSTAIPQLLDPAVEADPYAYYAALRQLEGVRFDDSSAAYLLVRHEDVGAAYRHPAFTTENYAWQLEPALGRTMLQMGGTEHSRVRGLLAPSFRGKGLAAWLTVIEANVTSLLDRSIDAANEHFAALFSPGTTVDIVEDFGHLYPVYVIADMLALPKEDHARFYRWYQVQTAVLSNLSRDPAIVELGHRNSAELRNYLRPIVQQRRTDPGEDFISMLATSEIDGVALTDDEVMTHTNHLLNAGSETTDRTIANLLMHLLVDRQRYEEVEANRDMVVPAISETLRLTPPSQMNGRLLSEEVTMRGVTMPAGSLVMLIMASANRDEARYEHPDVFDLHRSDLNHETAFSGTGEHFAFGYGRHFCLGAMVAKSELSSALGMMLDRFPGMRLASADTPQSQGLKMRSPRELRVVL